VPDATKKLAKKLGVTFADKDLLTQALVHRSYLNENRDFRLPHNERLEFLGDAVLELVVTDHLYRTYENPEGDLTSWRSAVVRGEKLAVLADRLGVGGVLLMSRGEEKSGGRTRPMLLANAFEAIVGAMYLDQGYDVTKEFIHRTVVAELPKIITQNLDRDAKSLLQEVAQEAVGLTPRYKVTEETGPDHDKHFTVAVSVGDNELGVGSGSSKQQAEQGAAEQALKGNPKQKLRKPR
jgi:ribonuclease-3